MALQRPLKEGSVRTYQEKVALNFKDILASEADGDHDTMYAAWNGALGGDLTGTLPNPTVVAAAKSKWSVSGTTLTPTDATKNVAIPGPTTAAQILFGTQTAKGRVQASNTSAWTMLSSNYDLAANTQDDPTKPSWGILARSDQDAIHFRRMAPSGGATSTLLTLDNAGTLTLAGDSAAKTNIVLGAQTAKGRVQTLYSTTTPYACMSINRDVVAGVSDDTSRPAWQFALALASDSAVIARTPAGGAL